MNLFNIIVFIILILYCSELNKQVTEIKETIKKICDKENEVKLIELR